MMITNDDKRNGASNRVSSRLGYGSFVAILLVLLCIMLYGTQCSKRTMPQESGMADTSAAAEGDGNAGGSDNGDSGSSFIGGWEEQDGAIGSDVEPITLPEPVEFYKRS